MTYFFKISYHYFYHFHQFPKLFLSHSFIKNQKTNFELKTKKSSKYYSLCEKIIADENNLLQEVYTKCKPIIGLNLPIISCIIELCKFLKTRITANNQNMVILFTKYNLIKLNYI